MRQCTLVHFCGDGGVLKDHFDLTAPNESSIRGSIIKRLYANTIAGTKQLLFFLVPDGNGKHPQESFETIRSPLPVCVENCFGIGLRVIGVTLCLELRADRTMV